MGSSPGRISSHRLKERQLKRDFWLGVSFIVGGLHRLLHELASFGQTTRAGGEDLAIIIIGVNQGIGFDGFAEGDPVFGIVGQKDFRGIELTTFVGTGQYPMNLVAGKSGVRARRGNRGVLFGGGGLTEDVSQEFDCLRVGHVLYYDSGSEKVAPREGC